MASEVNYLPSNEFLGLYIHVPFCESKCYYCDFFSETNIAELEEIYLKNTLDELKKYSQLVSSRPIKTIYIGGGTPNQLSNTSLESILNSIHKNFNTQVSEFTIELNPNIDIDRSFLRSIGVNRVSLGIQSINDESLKSVNRNHTAKEAMFVLDRLSEYFDNISCDLILGLPFQTLNDIDRFFKQISERAKHISMYMLDVPKGSKLMRLLNSGELPKIDQDIIADIYNYALKSIEEYGYSRYEISNFCKDGYESKHNLIYWSGDDYIGVGPSAVGRIANSRYSNSSNIVRYDTTKELLFKTDIEKEYIMLNLRLERGINLNDYKKRFNNSFLDKYKVQINKNKDYLIVSSHNDVVKIKPEFLIFENSIIVDFF